MNRDAWGSLKKNLFFSSEDVAVLFGATRPSAQVFCSRQLKKAALTRQDYNTKLCSLLEADQRPYYRQNNFRILTSYLGR